MVQRLLQAKPSYSEYTLFYYLFVYYKRILTHKLKNNTMTK
jgi:hypothetical protein